jgi:cysteinyl-tRNA synthetase
MTLRLYNQLTHEVDEFTPIDSGEVKIYTCGPTVYDYPHVGNWAGYVYWDILIRSLTQRDYSVNRVMNITDVGHLVSDEDEGEDKLEKGARREGKTAWEVADFYTKNFLSGIEKLNLIMPQHITRATDFIDEQLELVRTLKLKGFTYQTDDGIYYDTSKFPAYANFAKLNTDSQRAGARVEYNPQKRNSSDFALWKFSPQDQKRDMEWNTPKDLLESTSEGPEEPVMGFPGWHIECSAMAMNILGDTLDIHTGGVDHIPVHHTNEIAQSEGATGKTFSNFWLHNNHLTVDGTKISKSLGNGYTLEDIEEQDYSALDYRMFVLQSHYRNQSNFSFDNLEAAKNRRKNWINVSLLRHQAHKTIDNYQTNEDALIPKYASSGALLEIIGEDLDTPGALAFIDNIFDEISNSSLERINLPALNDFLKFIDELLGLDLLDSSPDITDEAKRMILQRERYRENKQWDESDKIRDSLEEYGLLLNDTTDGTIWSLA